MRSFPPDVIIIDREGLRATRLESARGSVQAGSFVRVLFPEPCFDDSPTPRLQNPDAFVATAESLLRRRKMEGVSVLLPDSWFRTRIIEMETLPDNPARQEEAIRWAMKKHSPARPEEARLAWHVIEREGKRAHLLVLESNEYALSMIESSLERAGLRVVLIEPFGLNIWNALTMTTDDDGAERILVVAAHDDLALMHFRGSRPLFIRARRIDPARALRDIRLSASYMRQNTTIESPAACWVVGDQLGDEMIATLRDELRTTTLRPTPEELGVDTSTVDDDAAPSDIMAALGVFAA